jgi:PadR family transcriptional regulator, regulatory protein PadR
MITAQAALLQVLREGPGYGRELVRRINRASAGRLRFAEGSIYPALRRLEAARLVRSWGVVPGRRRGGRARTYYELTERGVRASEVDRVALLRLAAPESPVLPGPEVCRRMLERIELGAELSEEAGQLSLRVPRSRRGRAA